MSPLSWEPITYINLDPMLMRPVEEGLWKLHETYDGTYIVDDLFDINEILDVRIENKLRAQAAGEAN